MIENRCIIYLKAIVRFSLYFQDGNPSRGASFTELNSESYSLSLGVSAEGAH